MKIKIVDLKMQTHVVKVHKGNEMNLNFFLSLFSAWIQKTSSNWKEKPKFEMDLLDKSQKADFEKID